MRYLVLTLPLTGAACADHPSHLPNPLLLPAQAVSATVQNASYDARRERVKDHVTAHHAEILSEIAAGGGARLFTAMELAWVSAPKRPALIDLLRKDIALYREDPEALTVALMVHGA